MKIRYIIAGLALIVFSALIMAFVVAHSDGPLRKAEKPEDKNKKLGPSTGKENTKEIYLAGGCFWGMEGYFQKVKGILDTEVGYANGNSDETSYRRLHDTKHAETLKLVYDANTIQTAEIIDRFLRIIDPYSLNKQGNDMGEQYRTGIYYTDKADEAVAQEFLNLLEKRDGKKPVVELEPLEHFIPAEPEHQDYLLRNPGGYCHINLSEAVKPLYPGDEKPDDATLRKELSDLEYDVTQKAATEYPGTSKFLNYDTAGIYVDIVTGQPLFSTDDQFDSGCGWPSFTKPITTDVILYNTDDSHGMVRTEVRSETGDSHLGHVFEDGPKDDGGLRYCINGAALRFIPYDKMADEGYAFLMPYVRMNRP